jgi:nucleoside-diphosphate-sugar epimerase
MPADPSDHDAPQALVTGGAGFLGRHVAEELLREGWRVRALVRRDDGKLTDAGAELVLGDLLQPNVLREACAGCDAVFHVAGLTGLWGPWKHFQQANVQGTQNVIEACRAAGVRRLVFTSSPSVTFSGGDQCGIDESAPYPAKWLGNYSRSKALAEQHVLTASGDGLATCALRPHLVWGPGDRRLIPRIVAHGRAGKLRRVGDGTNLVDVTYVENAALAHRLAGEALRPGSPLAGKAYFVSQGQPVNCWEWINQVLSLAGVPAVSHGISASAARRLGAALEGLHRVLPLGEPRMTRFLAAQLSTSHYFDISAARRDFGYAPRVSMEEGMRRLGEWLITTGT